MLSTLSSWRCTQIGTPDQYGVEKLRVLVLVEYRRDSMESFGKLGDVEASRQPLFGARDISFIHLPEPRMTNWSAQFRKSASGAL